MSKHLKNDLSSSHITLDYGCLDGSFVINKYLKSIYIERCLFIGHISLNTKVKHALNIKPDVSRHQLLIWIENSTIRFREAHISKDEAAIFTYK